MKNPYKFDDKYNPEIPPGALQIFDQLKKDMKEPDTNVNRASAANACARKRWYQRLGYEAEPMNPRAKLVFSLGNIAEKSVIYHVSRSCVGPGKIYSEVHWGTPIRCINVGDEEIWEFKQIEWMTTIDKLKIPGHPDGIGKRNSDGKWELIEIKSYSNYGFKTFKNEGPGEYLKQAHCLMMSDEAVALDIKEVRFWGLRKDTSHPHDSLHQFDKNIAELVKDDFLDVMKETPPAKIYDLVPQMKGQGRGKPKKATGKLTAQYPCTYCPYLKHCQGDFERVVTEDKYQGHWKPEFVFSKQENEDKKHVL